MADVVGQNTPSSERVHGFVSEIERLEAQEKELREQKKVIYATAKAEGFDTSNESGIRFLVRVRKKKPHDFEEHEANRDVYLHAMGMAPEPPLYKQIAALAKDTAASEKLLEAFKLLVPAKGELICTIGGKRMRLWRDKDGVCRSEVYQPLDAPGPSQPGDITKPPSKEVPDCSLDEAYDMGKEAYRENKPVISNPFPFGDKRRPRWDQGWRDESGNNGFGGK